MPYRFLFFVHSQLLLLLLIFIFLCFLQIVEIVADPIANIISCSKLLVSFAVRYSNGRSPDFCNLPILGVREFVSVHFCDGVSSRVWRFNFHCWFKRFISWYFYVLLHSFNVRRQCSNHHYKPTKKKRHIIRQKSTIVPTKQTVFFAFNFVLIAWTEKKTLSFLSFIRIARTIQQNSNSVPTLFRLLVSKRTDDYCACRAGCIFFWFVNFPVSVDVCMDGSCIFEFSERQHSHRPNNKLCLLGVIKFMCFD